MTVSSWVLGIFTGNGLPEPGHIQAAHLTVRMPAAGEDAGGGGTSASLLIEEGAAPAVLQLDFQDVWLRAPLSF